MTGVEGGSHYAHASHERGAFTAGGEGVRSLLEERTVRAKLVRLGESVTGGAEVRR